MVEGRPWAMGVADPSSSIRTTLGGAPGRGGAEPAPGSGCRATIASEGDVERAVRPPGEPARMLEIGGDHGDLGTVDDRGLRSGWRCLQATAQAAMGWFRRRHAWLPA